MNTTPRIIVLGLDGSPYKLIKTYVEQGLMPNLKALTKQGSIHQMNTVLPELSAPAWSSFSTGKNPAKTGIFGFFDLKPGTYTNIFNNYNNLNEPTLWNIIHKEKRKASILINIPSTFPAKPMNGITISGFVSTDINKSVYPETLLPLLKQMNYQVDLNLKLEELMQNLDPLIIEANNALESRAKMTHVLWDKLDWQLFVCVITGTDRLQHFIMDAFNNPSHPYNKQFEAYYQRIDNFIGYVNSKLNENDILILLSDHGFEVTNYEVYLNVLFKQKGWLEEIGGGENCYENITNKTKIFALDPARVYINRKSRFPNGQNMSEEEYKAIIETIKAEVEKLRSPEGKRVVKHTYKKEEIYNGKFFDQAPDLIFVPEEGFTFKGAPNASDIFLKPTIHFGGHNAHDAFLACNHKMQPDGKPNIMDLTPTILNLLGVDVNKYSFDGKPIDIVL